MRQQQVMTDLVDRFKQTVIRQFYATLEINMVEETFRWTTGKRNYGATFAQFAEANQLDYNFITSEQSVNIVLENSLDENDYPMFYEPAHLGIARTFGALRV